MTPRWEVRGPDEAGLRRNATVLTVSGEIGVGEERCGVVAIANGRLPHLAQRRERLI